MKGIRSERLRRLVKCAEEQGWTTVHDGRGHVRATNPDTGNTFWVSATANDKAMGHHYENTKATARRAGLDTRGLDR